MFCENPTSRTRVPVLKITGRVALTMRLRCDSEFGFMVHWLGRRSFVCPGSDCAACTQFVGARWSGLVAVDFWRGANSELGFALVELTEGAACKMKFIQKAVGADSFAGLCVIGSRSRVRGPLMLEHCYAPPEFGKERKAWPLTRIADAAATLYGLPCVEAGESVVEYGLRAEPAARSMIGRAMSTMSDLRT